MKGIIEFTTSPPKLPKRAMAKRWPFIVIMTLYLGVSFGLSSLTWREMLHRALSLRTALELAVLLIVSWLAYLGARRRLCITPEYVEYSNRLPRWLKSLHPSWRIERGDLTSVFADLGHGSGMKGGWRIRFLTKGKERRSIGLLGWYRVGMDVEGQSADVEEGAVRVDYTAQVKALTIIAALTEAGFPMLIDAEPAMDSFSNTRVGRAMFAGGSLAVISSVVALANWSDLYATHAPWAFILAVGGLAGALAWMGLRPTDIPREDRTLGIVAVAALFCLAAWAAAPLLNGMTSGGYQEVRYRYAGVGEFEGVGIFVPERPDAPTLDLSFNDVSFKSWRPGEQVVLCLRRGALGFWQYDRDLAIAAINARSK